MNGPVIGGFIGVHLGLHSVFFVTGTMLIACAGLAQCGRVRASGQRAPASVFP
jgi:hypothetical protein